MKNKRGKKVLPGKRKGEKIGKGYLRWRRENGNGKFMEFGLDRRRLAYVAWLNGRDPDTPSSITGKKKKILIRKNQISKY